MTIAEIVRGAAKVSKKRIPPKPSGAIKIVNVEYLHAWQEVDLDHSPGNVLIQLKHEGVTITGKHTVSLIIQTPKHVSQQVAAKAPRDHFKVRLPVDYFSSKTLNKIASNIPGAGKMKYIKKPSKRRADFLINCSCPDFYFTWGIWVFKKGDLVGPKPPPYKRKTPPPPVGYPWRNPYKVPGGCKHVMNSLDFLVKKGYLSP